MTNLANKSCMLPKKEEKVDNYNWFVEEGFISVDVDPSSITFIHNPDEFFQFLKVYKK